MSRFTFTMRLTVAGSAATATATAPTSSRVVRELLDEQRPPPSRVVRELLDEQRPREMMDNMALIIIDQTYSALLEILGPEAPPSGDDGHVQVSRPVDPADPESPLLSVNASATHCCIRLTDSVYGGGPDYSRTDSPKQSSNSQYRLGRATITASPGTLHLARVVDGGARGDYWACADVRPDVAGKGLLGVLETINARLDAAIRLEDTLLGMAKSSGCRRSPKIIIREIVEVREALEKMKAAADLDAIMMRRRRRRQSRCRLLVRDEITCRSDVDQVCDAEVLAKRFSTLHVGKKRGCPAQDTSCRLPPEPDDAEVLTKKLKALHV